jgi:hypothetical protein
MRKVKNLIICLCLVLAWPAIGHAGTLTATCEDVAKVYTSQVGVRELTGRNDGVQVRAYLNATGLSEGYAWCAAFVSWCFDQSGIDALHNAWAPAWFPAGKTIYTKGKHNAIVPRKADVFGVYHANLKRIGHVGFIDSWPPDGDYVITVEGNTNNAGSREGDGVYRKRRPKSNIYKVSRWL